jgi:site-specific DNA-cytosine methylase
MKKWAYYNEHDPYAAAWIRELMKAGHIMQGEVDERSIEDVLPSDIAGFIRCHWFAGIAGWDYALRLANFPIDREVWTGSCPCQPFSTAGKGNGTEDDRHLWPIWYRLIQACNPHVVFGEQVASSLVLGKATNESLQSLQKKFAGNGLFEAYRRALEINLQGMSGGTCKRKIRDIGQSSSDGEISPISRNQMDNKQGLVFNNSSETAGEIERGTLRPRSVQAGNSGHNKSGCLPSNGDSIRHGSKARLEQPFFGQNKSEQRVCQNEHSSGAVFAECDDARLGDRSSKRDYESIKSEGQVDDKRKTANANNTEYDEKTERGWIDIVFDDLESSGYACAAVDFSAAGVGAPHIRQRLYWVGGLENAQLSKSARLGLVRGKGISEQKAGGLAGAGVADGLDITGQNSGVLSEQDGGMAEPHSDGCGARSVAAQAARYGDTVGATCGEDRHEPPGPTNGLWRDADWLFCRDGKWRPVEPGTFPLAHGLPARVGRLRGYGNAIVPQAAQAFIEAWMECNA